MEAMDLFKFNSTNLDPLTETYGVDYYLGYVTKWPHLCRVMEDRNGKIEGYSTYFFLIYWTSPLIHANACCWDGRDSGSV